MTKEKAIEIMVNGFQAVPREWVQIIKEGDHNYQPLGMWGTCFIISSWQYSSLETHRMYMDVEDLRNNLNSLQDKEKEKLELAIKDEEYEILENYIDEEMAGAYNVVDREGRSTAMYICDLGGKNVLSINGAGCDFYDGVWDVLYVLIGLLWHSEY